MADNYLEKRMEDYACGRFARQGHAKSRRDGVACVKYPQQEVLLVNAGNEKSRAVIRRLVEAGNRVVFTASDAKLGAVMAQECGGRFYPMALDDVVCDLARRGERLDAAVVFGDEFAVHQGLPGKKILVADGETAVNGTVALVGGSPDAVAMAVLALVHPALSLPAQTLRLS